MQKTKTGDTRSAGRILMKQFGWLTLIACTTIAISADALTILDVQVSTEASATAGDVGPNATSVVFNASETFEGDHSGAAGPVNAFSPIGHADVTVKSSLRALGTTNSSAMDLAIYCFPELHLYIEGSNTVIASWTYNLHVRFTVDEPSTLHAFDDLVSAFGFTQRSATLKATGLPDVSLPANGPYILLLPTHEYTIDVVASKADIIHSDGGGLQMVGSFNTSSGIHITPRPLTLTTWPGLREDAVPGTIVGYFNVSFFSSPEYSLVSGSNDARALPAIATPVV